MRVPLNMIGRPVVKLVDMAFTYTDWHLLIFIQANKPNMPIRYLGERGRDEYIPAHQLIIEDFAALKLFNP